MDIKTIAYALALAAVTTCCQIPANSSANRPAAPSASAPDPKSLAPRPEATSVPADIESTLESLSYLQARTLLLESGWSPVVSKTCNEDAVGSYERLCIVKKLNR
jgi:hypothetical protein